MISDNSLGLKVAENTDEAFWTDMKQKCRRAIDISKKDIIINEHIMKLCDHELVFFKRNGQKKDGST